MVAIFGTTYCAPVVCARRDTNTHSPRFVNSILSLLHTNTTTHHHIAYCYCPCSMASTSSSPSPSPRIRHPPSAFKDSSPNPKRNSDSFRSKSRLSNDPFSNSAFRERAPVVLNSERLYRAAAASHPTRQVILILGGQCILSDLPRSLPVSHRHSRTKSRRPCSLI